MLVDTAVIMVYTVHVVVGARPNQMKAAPLLKEMRKHSIFEVVFVDTGQHYDHEMSGIFMQQFGMGKPDFSLSVGSGSHGLQTSLILQRYEELLIDNMPDAVIVIGDINSTVACTLAAIKLGIKVIHLEAGLRSFDREMPEELNRIITDSVADLLWTPSPDGDDNLLNSGIDNSRIHRVGNIMIDTLIQMLEVVKSSKFSSSLELKKDEYVVVTLHRPSNVDHPDVLEKLLENIVALSERIDVVWPVHPRTAKRIQEISRWNDLENNPSIHLLQPLGYIDFMNGILHSRCVITDSGGIQEETTWLGIPCLTLRPNTERPITIEQGTNVLCTPQNLLHQFDLTLDNPRRRDVEIDLWDGKTAERCVRSLIEFLEGGL